LNGPIFGMRSDFKGFGVMFDVYDNDNRRDNPSIFVLKSDNGQPTLNHDNDFANDMITKVSSTVQGLDGGKQHHTAHKCVAEFRNQGKSSKVLIKFLHKILHVYIDTQDGAGYKFCLAVEMDRSYKDYHITFSAATGQVADNHDIIEIITRYLSETDKEVNDDLLPHLSNMSTSSSSTFLFWISVILVGGGLCFFSYYEIYLYSQLKQIDAVHLCQQLNSYVTIHYGVHFLLFVSLIFMSYSLWVNILNSTLIVYRIFLIATKNYKLNPSLVQTYSFMPWLYFTMCVYIISEASYLFTFSSL